MKLYFHYFTMELKSQMQYKASFLLAVFGQFVTAFSSFFGIKFIFAQIYEVDGFSYGQVLICFAVIMLSFALGEMAGGGLAVFDQKLSDGSFDRMLVRPRNVILQVVVPNMDFTRLGLVIQAAVVLAIAVPASGILWTWDKVLVLAAMVICGSVVFFCLFLIIASFAFFTVQELDIFNIFTYGMRQFGRYPFSIYGEEILKLLTFVVPMALFQYYPLLYLLDREKGLFYMISPLLSLLIIIPAWFLFRIGLRNYKSTGS